VVSVPPSRGERVADRYLVKEELASGGMGVVYRVFDRSAGEERALKRLSAQATAQPFLVEAFEREYQVLAGLDHPRIIRVHDYGVDEVGPYYTMELLDGEDMRAAAPLGYREACRYLRDVAASLALLHARRFIHRDLSPANVRLTPDGHCKLLDFGALSAFGNSRLVVGTPPVIPPEAVEGAPLDQRADLYSLGALAYWMLTRRHAYPAKQIDELEALWKTSPPAPSTLADGVPKDLDTLVLTLLSADPLVRPTSAAEVIARLNVIGDLAPEEGNDADRIAESFLLGARFVGRAAKLEHLEERTDALLDGKGSALRIEAVAGMGRTRLLEEIGVRAQIAGASVLRVDASTYRDAHGTARALAVRMLDALPHVSRECGRKYPAALAELGREVDARLITGASTPPPPGTTGTPAAEEPGGTLDGWFADVSRRKPLLIQVDNVDDADDASLGLLVALARRAAVYPLMLVVTERLRLEPSKAVGLVTLRTLCEAMLLEGLSPSETLELVRSIFGDAPKVERFAGWLHGFTAGSPLHCIEVSRHLVARGVVRYVDGMWILPSERPDTELSAELEDALMTRLASLSDAARGLAECLSLQREQPTFELCKFLTGESEDRPVFVLLDELARNDILYTDRDGYRFSSMALREVLRGSTDDARRQQNHRLLGRALKRLAGTDNPALLLQAGWHSIQGGAELRGADLVASVTHDSSTMRRLIANQHHAGPALEAALNVYKRHRRSMYERMPLLSALAHAGYYEDRTWGAEYGDEALDACEDLSGVRTARRLRRFIGAWLALAVGISLAFLRFHLTPKRERGYAFPEMLVQLFGVVTALSGAAALSLDVERAASIASMIEIFSVLPERVSAAGIYAFCEGLKEIGREHQGRVFESFGTLRRRFEDPRYYRELPDDARVLYVGGALFARGAFATMLDDSRIALECADALDACGMKLYTMIASQIRFLCYANRGELDKAAEHREQVELHAARVGSAWQVETWEQPSLIPLYVRLDDVVALKRAADRLERLGQTIPTIKRYARLARLALMHVQGEAIDDAAKIVEQEVATQEPRSFIGWSSSAGFMARALNRLGRYAEAKQACELVLPHLTERDRDYVTLFLDVDLEMAIAEAGVGSFPAAFARIDALLVRFRESDNPMVQGKMHETRARVAFMAGRMDDYRHGLALAEHWFRATGTPALIASYERLAALAHTEASVPAATDAAGAVTAASTGATQRTDSATADVKTVVSKRRTA
jgi:tetratricopeptide (TPR) repeat protein